MPPPPLSNPSKTTSSIFQYKRKKFFFVFVFLLLVFCILEYRNEKSLYNSYEHPLDTKFRDKVDESQSTDDVKEEVKQEPVNVANMLNMLESAMSEVEKRVRVDYGEYFDMFFSSKALSNIMQVERKSADRLVNKLKIKLISAQLSPEETSFVWSTGGHSAAAGHGNLLSQSYTAVLEDTVKEAFASLNITFLGRNHAMGGYKSAPEIACCLDSIFGRDTDILSWDFGMTDGKETERLLLYSHRAALLRSDGMPFLFYLTGPKKEYQQLEKNGLALGYLKEKVLGSYVDKLPDFEDYDIINGDDDFPRAIKYLRCGKWFETQNTMCRKFKFNISICTEDKYQTSWHPGWKEHMGMGRRLGFFLLSNLKKAIEELNDIEKEGNFSLSYMNELLEREKSIQADFLTKPYPKMEFLEIEYDFNYETLYRQETACNTAVLPSIIRYHDALETPIYDEYNVPSFVKNESTPLYLVWEPGKRFKCELPLTHDYKDYFLVRDDDGLVSTTVPTGHETQYNESSLYLPKRKGNIMICQPECPWGRCLEGSIHLSSMNHTSTHIRINVNEQEVVRAQNISENCYFLENAEGTLDWGESIQYNISFFVNKTRSFLQMSSIIVF